MSSTDTLDLSLSEYDIDEAVALSTSESIYRDVADAATAKAAYAILDWLGEWGMHSFCGDHHPPPVEYAEPKLRDILAAAGIQKPEGD